LRKRIQNSGVAEAQEGRFESGVRRHVLGMLCGLGDRTIARVLVQWVAMDVSGTPNIGFLREINTPAPPELPHLLTSVFCLLPDSLFPHEVPVFCKIRNAGPKSEADRKADKNEGCYMQKRRKARVQV
jgi:hypothetical protein